MIRRRLPRPRPRADHEVLVAFRKRTEAGRPSVLEARRLMRSFAVASSVVVMVGGCSGLPDSSIVRTGKSIGAADEREQLAVKPDGPLSGDDVRQISAGFLRAHIDSTGNYQVAREFLTPAAAAAWKPGGTVRIFDAHPDDRPDIRTDQRGDNRVEVTLAQVAELGPDGHLHHFASPRPVTMTFTLARTRDGWRISELPASVGVWLSEDDLSRLYTRANVYYVQRGSSRLIPDLRWFPRPGLATALARAALSTPPGWLAGAVKSPYPIGTRLTVNAVPVDDNGVARIDLSSQAASASSEDRKRIWAALTSTLTQAPTVMGVDISVNSGPLDAPGVSQPFSDISTVGQTTSALAIPVMLTRSRYLAWTRSSAFDAVSGTDRNASQGRPALPAIDPDLTQLAAGRAGAVIAGVPASRDQLKVYFEGTSRKIKPGLTNLRAPIVDPQGWVFTAGEPSSPQTQSRDDKPASAATQGKSTDASQIRVARATDSTMTTLTAAALAGQHVVSWAMSADGSRLALLLRAAAKPSVDHGSGETSGKPQPVDRTKSQANAGDTDDQKSRIVVAAITRDAQCTPRELGPFVDLDAAVTGATDIAWADPTSVAVLGTFDNTRQPIIVRLDATTTPLGPVTNADGLVSANGGADGVFVRRADRSVMSRQGSGWASFLTGGDVIVPLG